ncbi:MAG: hypothetical protein JSR45_03090 [Proteobacteria bacterium]|nr:hypothetical protein [Pseudomonadota bacterium]
MRSRFLPCAMALLLCGCRASGDAKSMPEAYRPHVLNGVDLAQDLTLQGAEPFWDLQIVGRQMRFDHEATHAIAPNPGLRMKANTAVWSTRTAAGVPIRVVVTSDKCSDGMGPHDYPLRARVIYGDVRFDGCADVSALLREPEVGDPGDLPTPPDPDQ